jgi:hypothetical protein
MGVFEHAVLAQGYRVIVDLAVAAKIRLIPLYGTYSKRR